MTATDRGLSLAARTDAGPDTFEFRTADGVHSADAFRTSELLLLETLWERSPDRLLCPAANYGVVGTVLAAEADHVTMTETSVRAATLCSRNAARNRTDAAVAVTGDLTRLSRTFDAVAYAPKPYTPIPVGKQRLADALQCLEPGGRLFLAGSTDTGLSRYRSVLADAAGGVDQLTKRDGHRVLAATRPASVDPPRPVEPKHHHATVDGVDLSMVSVPGLFSANRLDDGTRLLLETVDVADGQRVLDLCCGYGPIGAYAAAAADCEVWLTDDDRRATIRAERTLDATGVDGTVVTGDGVGGVADLTFDRVLSNPPTHAGSGVLADLFSGARRVLSSRGRLTFVHHRSLDLSGHCRRFDDVRTVATGEEHVVREATV